MSMIHSELAGNCIPKKNSKNGRSLRLRDTRNGNGKHL